MKPVVVLGDESLRGTYLLRMNVLAEISVSFGKFQDGEPILIPKGEMIYLGSAMRGLASRVLRHALRAGDKPRHLLYVPLLEKLEAVDLVNNRFRAPSQKKLHWHIDYLLDETAVSLSHAILIRSQQRLEDELGAWLLTQPETKIVFPGLGASDVKGHTHMLQLQAHEAWWPHFIKRQIENINQK